MISSPMTLVSAWAAKQNMAVVIAVKADQINLLERLISVLEELLRGFKVRGRFRKNIR
jgi:hypothetical protein